MSEGLRLLWQALSSRTNQDELRQELGIGQGVLGRWLYGDRTPELESAVKIEARLGIPVSAWLQPPTEPFALPPIPPRTGTEG